jgi:hypothetical protein
MSRTLAAAAALALLLTGCSAVDEATGPDPDEAAQRLADGLASGDLAEVRFTGDGAQQSYDEVVEGLGETTPTVSVEDVTEADGTATATLGWSWPVSEQDWTYTSEATLRLADDRWEVSWSPSVVEPSLRAGGTLGRETTTAKRADILGARGERLVTERPVTRFGIDKSAVSAQRAAASAQQLAALVDVDAASYVKQVEASGDLAFVEAIVYRRDEVPVRVGAGYERIKGALAVQDSLALAPTREFAAPILGTVGEATAEMVEEDPERYQPGTEAGLSGLQLRYDQQLGGTPGCRWSRPLPTTSRGCCSPRSRSGARRCGSPSTPGCSRRPSGCWPRSGRRARWSRSGRPPARSSRRPTAPVPTATTWRRTGSSRPAPRSRPSARWRSCGPG